MNLATNIVADETKFLNVLDEIREDFPLLFLETNSNLNVDHVLVREQRLIRQKKMSVDGYFQERSALTQYKSEIVSLAELVDRLNFLELPPVILFYIDFAWLIFKSLNDLFTDALGDDFMFLPDFWAWHVDHKRSRLVGRLTGIEAKTLCSRTVP